MTGSLGNRKLSDLPEGIYGSSMVLHNETILLCGGVNNKQKCLQLDHGTWKEHSTLNEKRSFHSAATTQKATFLFGGFHQFTYEYLPKDSKTWIMGKTEIPEGFVGGYAISVKSGTEIWLIGGVSTGRRILSFNVNDHTFRTLPSKLIFDRFEQRCAFIPNTNKIMIIGGLGCLTSTEILDTENGSVTKGSPMNSTAFDQGIGVVTINGEERLTVFGGYDPVQRTGVVSVELYNTQTEKWEMTDMKLKEPKSEFSFLTLKLGNIISKL